MKIEVWSDFICPFCYIAKRQLERALTDFKHAEKVFIDHKSYELSPNQVFELEKSSDPVLAENSSLTREQTMRNNLQQEALSVGLKYDLEKIKQTNTFDAHRLAKYAIKQGKGSEMVERLLRAYFTEGAHIGNHKTLVQLAMDVGLNETKVAKVLHSGAYEAKVRCDQIEAQQIGVQAVPFFVFNEKYAISGAQSPEVFLEVLEKVWGESSEYENYNAIKSRNSETTYCTGESCDKHEDTLYE